MTLTEELKRWAWALAEVLETAKGKRSFVDCLEMAESAFSDLALKHTLKNRSQHHCGSLFPFASNGEISRSL
ncbi:MAG: hypothetical protein ACK40X_10045 [Armatimonadota bacterium]